MVSSDIVAESRSWGEMVRAIDAERRTLPWAQNEFVRNEIITLAERKLKDRDIDLFTMAFRDPVRENQRILTQAAADVKLLTLQEEASRKKYNIINHIGLSKTDRLLIASRKVRDREHDWHPSSHLKNTSSDDRLKSSKMIHVRSKRGSGLDRDFDIVSGKFKVDDDGKQLLIKQQVRDKCEEKFWQTHDYDCIKVKSYDPKLQEKFLKENIAIEKSQGLLQASKFPHCMSHSEGQTYNILNDSILDAGKLKIGPLQNKIRALNRMRAVKMEDYFHTAGDEKAFISAEKSLRKITSKRWNAELSRGYDVVSNCPFDVEGASVSVSVPVPVLTRTCSSSEMRGQKHENHHRFCPGKRMTVQNNYLGTHTGTGMNIRRAHTSYPTIPVERIVSDLDDEDVQIEDFEEAQSANTADIEKEKEFSSFDILCGGKNERIRNNFSKSTQVTLSNNISKGGIFVSVDPKYLPSESGRSLRSLDLGILSVRTGGITSLP